MYIAPMEVGRTYVLGSKELEPHKINVLGESVRYPGSTFKVIYCTPVRDNKGVFGPPMFIVTRAIAKEPLNKKVR